MMQPHASFPSRYVPASYWEDRAQRFAGIRGGLAAVCAYGMPEFYNKAIDFEQRRALMPLLAVRPGLRVLDVGCGIGRWSRHLAKRGAIVQGIDISPTMIAQACARAALDGTAERCRFAVHDVSTLDLADERFDLVLGVTVLQHILDADALRSTVTRLRRHLAPGGRMVLLEAAPRLRVDRCDSRVFTARSRATYLRLFEECGLVCRTMRGVDPAPFRTRLLPHLPRLPRLLRLGFLALATWISLPVNWAWGPRALDRSWHVVFALGHGSTGQKT
ncbi:MAG TPA: class I SAM-dependent methyltransferase [Steroidobacteraceae bacterium]|nr:class I SAM-dependent methyltransferase [Steroidobacteraceae bacterium]